MYDMLKETWVHQCQERPTFGDIVAQFPERRAQSVRAVVDCRDSAEDHLHFKKDDLIVVISRSWVFFELEGSYFIVLQTCSIPRWLLLVWFPSERKAWVVPSHRHCCTPRIRATVFKRKSREWVQWREIGEEEEQEAGQGRGARTEEAADQWASGRSTTHLPRWNRRNCVRVATTGQKSHGPDIIFAFDFERINEHVTGISCSIPCKPISENVSNVPFLRPLPLQRPPFNSVKTSLDMESVWKRRCLWGTSDLLAETLSTSVKQFLRRLPVLRPNHLLTRNPAHHQEASLHFLTPPTTSISLLNSFHHSTELVNLSPQLLLHSLTRLLVHWSSRFLESPSRFRRPTRQLSPTSMINRMTIDGWAHPSRQLVVSPLQLHSPDCRHGEIRFQLREVPSQLFMPEGEYSTNDSYVCKLFCCSKDIPTQASEADIAFCDKIENLNRDLTNYSIGTICDYSEDRPLLESFNRRDDSHPSTSSTQEARLRYMTEDEAKKMNEKSLREHRKTEDILKEERLKELKGAGDAPEEDTEATESMFTTRQRQQEGWSSAAQEAYKLLVECGTNLKHASVSPPPSKAMSPITSRFATLERPTSAATDRSSVSPAPPRPVTPPIAVRVDPISMRKPAASEDQMEQVTVVENSPKRVHIIETKLIDGPARGMSPVQVSYHQKISWLLLSQLQDRHVPAFTTPMSNTFRKAPAPTPNGTSQPDQKPPPCRPPKTRQFPLVIDERNLAYDNLNGFGAGARVAPPVPPKPKVR